MLPVVGSDTESVPVSVEGACCLSVRKDGTDSVERKLYLPHFCYAPVKKGSRAGELCVFLNGKEVWRTGLVTESAANEWKG